jgi:hypothetical protein
MALYSTSPTKNCPGPNVVPAAMTSTHQECIPSGHSSYELDRAIDTSCDVFPRPLQSNTRREGISQKEIRTALYHRVCSEIEESYKVISEKVFESTPACKKLNRDALSELPLSDLNSLLDNEIAVESLLLNLFNEVQTITGHLESNVLRPAQNDYRGSTGFLDDHPRWSAALCSVLGVATLSAGVTAAVLAHHPIHQLVEFIASSVAGHGFLGSCTFWAIYPFSLFVVGIPVLGSSILGPLAFGFMKTVSGKVARTQSETHRTRFKTEAEQSSLLLDKFHIAASEGLRTLHTLKPLLGDFFSRNEIIRSVASAHVIRTRAHGENQDLTQEVSTKSSALGKAEIITFIKLVNLEKKLHLLLREDFRSPELRSSVGDLKEPENEGLLAKIVRGHTMALSSIRSVLDNTAAIGAGTALQTGHEVHDTLEKMPTGILTDPFSAVGSGLSATLHLALETGARPEKAFLDAAKGVVGMVKTSISGGPPDGPSGETLLRVLLELDELERGNKIRWFFKLIPSLAWAVLKKPALIIKAQKHEEAHGHLSPKSLESEITDGKGRGYSAWKAVRELFTMVQDGIVKGAIRWMIKPPLVALSNPGEENEKAISSINNLSRRILKRIEVADEQRLRKLALKYLKDIPNRAEIRKMADRDLELMAIQMFVDYRFLTEGNVSQNEMNAVLGYWKVRKELKWKAEEDRTEKHRNELASINPQLYGLRELLRSKPSIFSSLFKSLFQNVRSIEQCSTEEGVRWKGLLESLRLIPSSLFPSKPIILEVSNDGQHFVVLETTGEFSSWTRNELKEKIVTLTHARDSTKKGSPIDILKHADEARIAACEEVLGTSLEPFQQHCILSVHHRMIAGSLSYEKAYKTLQGLELSREQIEGVYNQVTGVYSPGLLSSGVLG